MSMQLNPREEDTDFEVCMKYHRVTERKYNTPRHECLKLLVNFLKAGSTPPVVK